MNKLRVINFTFWGIVSFVVNVFVIEHWMSIGCDFWAVLVCFLFYTFVCLMLGLMLDSFIKRLTDDGRDYTK